MTKSALGGRKKRITIIASEKGVEIAEKSLIRLGFDSKSNFAKSQLLARSVVTDFFNRHPIQIDSFKKICIKLKLNWDKIVEIEEEQLDKLKTKDCSNLAPNEEASPVQTLGPQITVIDDDESNELNDKWRLVQEIVSQAVEARNLSDADLSGAILSGAILRSADLRSADLSGADLRSADLRSAYLSGADLSGAYLRSAILSGANLRSAILSYADLRSANLSGANLSDTAVDQAQFGDNLGLTKEMILDLKRRRAIFEDSSGDRSEILSRR